jgi:hypothetical protein
MLYWPPWVGATGLLEIDVSTTYTMILTAANNSKMLSGMRAQPYAGSAFLIALFARVRGGDRFG